MHEDTIPLEAGIEARAISLTKGCYVGQEVIIRVLHRGHGRVARRLVGLVLESDRAPSSGAAVTAGREAEAPGGTDDRGAGAPGVRDTRQIGHVTSATISPRLGKAIALAYIHRDFTAPGTLVLVGETPG